MWGNDAQENKVLLAIGLRDKENVVDIYVFPEEIATEEFFNILMNQWRIGEPVAFPDQHNHIERPLTVSDSLLPDEIKVDRTDLILRAQAEWHFVVLSAKLHENYKDEIESIRAKIEKLQEFENSVWEELKGYWGKVQEQVREKNLFREHAEELRQTTDELFDRLKQLRKKMDDQYKSKSKEFVESFMEELTEIQKKLEDGLGLKPIFDDLKKLQRKLKDTDFTKEHRRIVWQKIDQLFKEAKAKRGGPESQAGGSAYDRTKRRYDGLMNAIQKMERSIARDRNDLEFQNKRIEKTDGQLEAQLRQAKLVMIEQRVISKEEKLADMKNTQASLEERMKREEAKLEKIKEQKEVEKAKEEIKEKIQEQISLSKEALKEQEDKLKKAAEAIKESKGKKKPAPAKGAKDAKAKKSGVDEGKDEANGENKKGATSENTDEKGPTGDSAKENGKADEGGDKKSAGGKSKGEKVGSTFEEVEEMVEDTLEDVVDTIKAVATVVGDKAARFFEDFVDREGKKGTTKPGASKDPEAPVMDPSDTRTTAKTTNKTTAKKTAESDEEE
jgi:hypothetical protein